MKTLKYLFLISIPVVMLSCNQSQSSGKSSGMNTTNKRTETGMGARNTENDQMEAKDKDFVKEAAGGGLMEVELGRYAQQNARNPRVKQFGAMMVRDHSKANEELKGLASRKNVDLSDALDNSHQNKLSDLKQKTGSDFDEAYIKEMVDDHEKDVDKFKKQAEDGEDQDLKAFAAKTLPVLLMHQDSAKSIRDALSR